MNKVNEQDDTGTRENYTHQTSAIMPQHLAKRTAERQAAFLLPHLQPGMRLLDCGCGPGSITIGLAEAVAPGEVIGIDINVIQLAQAKEDAANRGIKNVRFETASIYELPFPDASFDAAFSNAVLSHLRDPTAALTEIRRVLKPGGVAGIRNPDSDGQVIAPAIPLVLRSRDIYSKVIAANGGNTRIGKDHKSLLRQVGFADIEVSAHYEVYGSDEAVRYWGNINANGLLNESAVELLTRLGLATADEIPEISRAWREWADNPDAFYADAWCTAVGWNQ